MRLPLPLTIAALSVLAVLGACATKDPTVEKLVGSEPQRLSFGAPADVRSSFLAKIKACWLNGPNAVLAGYKYEVGEEPDKGTGAYYGILISNAATPTETLEVQFHKYNENTLVVTRNGSLPAELVEKLKRDIQLWALTGTECSNS